MAIQTNGPLGPFSGKLGKVIGYVDKKSGKQRLRSIGKYRDREPSDAELATRVKTTITADFLSFTKGFTDIGFGQYAELQRMTSPWHAASSFTRKAITGKYPDLKIDFAKLLVSTGEMPVVHHPEVVAVEDALMFSLDTSYDESTGTAANDRVMLLAYFPDFLRSVYTISGARRSEGYDLLALPRMTAGKTVETFIAFMSADHKRISNSIYTGQIINLHKY
ncbi:hypothetical protein SAMN06265348_11652 [Pedobacter westerhofensis]|uniref:Uncharacterized protein n=1 Tax=Pedobacter westerhofensis TaxID=425512 RepID=A0A521FQ51_9SPHI|nr:DUF6266 family protein [Pedobacter westerhofensis]SMO98309.1 hypothetical protein SAMN06265348_11652 [Pedobacter westerhofensis]